MRNTEHTHVYCHFYCQFYFHYARGTKIFIPGNFHLWSMKSFLGYISRLTSKKVYQVPLASLCFISVEVDYCVCTMLQQHTMLV